VDTRFYVETTIFIDPFLGCNDSPVLLVPPIDLACTGVAWFHNPGAFDPDGDSLSFELTIPKQAQGTNVFNYRDPNHRLFYDRAGLDYNTANENKDGPPTFSINPVTGTLIWDAPGAAGEYNIAFKIIEWRKVSDEWVQMGYVIRDMQIIVQDCDNDRPDLIIPRDTCIVAGTLLEATIFGTDPNFDPVQIEAFSQVLNLQNSPATVDPANIVLQSTLPPNDTARMHFSWQTNCSHIKDQPYQVVFKILDRPPLGPRLPTFKTWNITVIAPEPEWVSGTVNNLERAATLNWENYECNNAERIQIWRRVDSFAHDPSACETGMPGFLGYSLISTVGPNVTQFIDRNLAVGAKYCYRLVAIFPQPAGGESRISQELCLDPILADAPVITHVTVEQTSESNGSIRVSWRAPFEIDEVQFPKPYAYEVYRANGFTGNAGITRITNGSITDTTFVDTGINTLDNVYNYRIVLYAPSLGTSPVDTSARASSVRLETNSSTSAIELTWDANVPWSNQSQVFPKHYIFRAAGSSSINDLVLIDSVNVNVNGFVYIDEGQFNDTALDPNTEYCYRVLTQGTYGNPEIDVPLQNFSQIICATPRDEEPPCQPGLSINLLSCEDFFATAPCNFNTFSNTLTWNRPADPICRADTRSYNIYATDRPGGNLIQIATNVRDTFYIDANLPSFARCYRISGVDRSGNESELSEEVCNDNCPYYELPNIFTPNGDGCNDTFSAFSDRVIVGESGSSICVDIDRSKCARFVRSVRFVVYNRWGKEVYRYQSGGERTIFIDWNGRDNNGVDLTTGIYYYHAEVQFDVLNPNQRTQEFKGWIHLLR
ncbi:MAG TPA: gliding motility-associated C-terminal domain-containing protein, partial [Cyclobacteriaceae bacterium]|nr:gliding motility-associated C-terminal domain-containing protein [Cyclobacteriaceae bacterium]